MSPASYTNEAPCLIFLYFILQITCAWGNCGPPPVIEHTKEINETFGVPGQAVAYTCDRSSGYYDLPDKSKTITCQDDNTWSVIPVFCARACDVPERLLFAVSDDLDKDIFLPGTAVSYTCRPGYRRAPFTKASIKCLSNYTWSQPDNFCTRRSCGSPGEIINGEREADDFLFGSRVIFKCNEGYHITSKRPYRDCLADGKWSNDLPECEAVICSPPEKPINGSFDPYKDEYTFLDAVTFSCKRGLHFVGEATISCTAEGSWSATTPTCTGVQCSDPHVPNSIRLSGFRGPYSLNSAVLFECKNDYVMNGSSSITCQITSEWEPKVPECLTVCVSPPDLPYAELDESSALLPNYFSGTTVQYKCKHEYERVPNTKNTTTCLDKSWSTADEFCKTVCVSPPDLPYAELDESSAHLPNYFSGTTVQYKCKHEYELVPYTKNNITCLDKSWSTADEFCKTVCESPPTLSYAELDESSAHLPKYFSGTIVRYNCTNDYKRDPDKENSITCVDKSWSMPDQFCIRIKNPVYIYIIIGTVCVFIVLLLVVLVICCCKKMTKSGKPQVI
ncbi:complement receptor type 1-like isoform X2 [Pseudophryne corroboree]|uniref:complement receptor type 1-like isoform X2 n=1 Tax=Pseudophryne corroboree TaxID=495146 RepID=UPI0030818049